MQSISGKNWEEIVVENRLIEKIKIDENFDDIQAKIVISRFFSKEEIFSINNKINFSNPFHNNKDFLSACDLLELHISNQNEILIIGDYDVDGCLSTGLMVKFLKKNNAKINYYIPDRFKDGYGASKKLIIRLTKKYNPNLIIFLDCGSNSYDALRYIETQKISSLIIDHHNVQKPYPFSNTFINPKKNIGYEKYNYLCTTFLTFLFLDIYLKKKQVKYSLKEDHIYILLATVADVMPIRGINRLFAINVLKNFDINKDFIFTNLFKILNLNKKLNLGDLGFLIAPIFNAAGRLDNANQIIELLVTTSNKKKLNILNNIHKLNNKRKIIQDNCLQDINFKKLSDEKGILFLTNQIIPEGIIGIIASKIKDLFDKPCVVFTKSNNIIKGSARSTLDFNIGEYIQKALNEKILLGGGGHNLAAGVSLTKSKINNFKKFLNNHYINRSYSNKYVSKISLNSINKIFSDRIKILGPFGSNNPNPIFLVENVEIIKPKIIKKKFITCFIKKNKKIVKATSFNYLETKISYEILNSRSSFDILVKVKHNNWNNKSVIELEIIDLIKNINKT